MSDEEAVKLVTAAKHLSDRDVARIGQLRRKYGAHKGLSLEFEQKAAERLGIPATGGCYRIVLVPPNALPQQEQRMHLQWYADSLEKSHV